MSLDNEYILRYHDNFIENGMFCIITEYCSVYSKIVYFIIFNRTFYIFKGGNLASQIRDKINSKSNFEFETVFKWTEQMIYGLNYLFTKSVIHRDIKPG